VPNDYLQGTPKTHGHIGKKKKPQRLKFHEHPPRLPPASVRSLRHTTTPTRPEGHILEDPRPAQTSEKQARGRQGQTPHARSAPEVPRTQVLREKDMFNDNELEKRE